MVTIKQRARQRGKRNQRKIAQLLNGDNRGIIGFEDVRVLDKYYIECKEREDFPKWLTKMWEQTLYNTPFGKVPVLQLHKLGTSYLNKDLVVLPLSEFKNIIGGN